MRWRRLAVLASGLVLAGVVACGPKVELPPLEPVPHPELAAESSGVEDAVRQQIGEARQALDEARDEAESLPAVAAAYGDLAETYHAYDLHTPAAVAYANASTLEPRNPVWPYEHGLLAQSQGDFAHAADLFGRALELQPSMHAARLRRADALLESGDAEAARAALADGPSEGPAELEAAHAWVRGRIAASLGEHGRAVEAFESILEAYPGASVVRRPLARSLLQLGRRAEADAQMEAIPVESPGQVPFPDPHLQRIQSLARSPGAFLRRGNQALVAGRVDRAVDLFRDGLEIDPEHLELRINLGLAQVRAQEPDAALETLLEAVKRHPDSAQAHHDLGTVLRARRQFGDAVEAFERAVELRPDYPEAWFNLSNALAAAERWEEAEDALERHLEKRPDDSRSIYLLAMSRHEQGRTDEAIAMLRRHLDADPADPQIRRGLAQILDRSGRSSQAIQVWKAAADLDPPAPHAGEALDAAARIAWRTGQRQEALRIWRRWVDLEPSSSAAHTALANGLQLLGRHRGAELHFRRAVELDPQNATAALSEASLLLLRGAFADAETRLEEAVELHPDHPGLLDTLARVLATAPDPGLRDGEEALRLARKAHGLSGDPKHGETVGMALAELGRFDEAIRNLSPLAMQARDAGDRAALARLASQLRSYQQRQPLRAPGG